jgi:hypothetical protein
MRKLLAFVAAFASVLLIAGCGGGGKPGAPANVAVAPRDSSAIVTWDMNSGVDYWVWLAPGSTVTLNGCAGVSGCQIHRGATSPLLILGLVNGTTYSVIVNASSGSGPVGDSSAPIAFVPNVVGSTWTSGKPLASTLLGVSYTGAAAITASTFIAVGTGGGLYSSANGISWTALTSNVATNLNAVQYVDARFVAVGDTGLVLVSSDSVTWTPITLTSNNLYALTVNGSRIVTVGANGVILTSGDGLAWAPQNSGTSKDLYGIVFGNGLYVAVGAEGTVLTSADGVTWQTQAPQTSLNLKSIAYGAGRFVAVGASGALVTSTDGVTWIAAPPIATNSLSSVVVGTQFVAAGSGGGIFTSGDGITWVAAVSGTTNDLHALTFSPGNAAIPLDVGYVAVGVAGTNLTAF